MSAGASRGADQHGRSHWIPALTMERSRPMTINAAALPAAPRPSLRLVAGSSAASRSTPWWERRAMLRVIVGGCPDHWWNHTARRTAACTCDRF